MNTNNRQAIYEHQLKHFQANKTRQNNLPSAKRVS